MLVVAGAYAWISTARNNDETWVWDNPLPQGNQINSMSFVTTDTGWAAGRSGVVLKTSNGGYSWRFQDAGVYRDWNAVSFASTSTGWVAGEGGAVKRTTDGGSTWTTQSVSANSAIHGLASRSTTQVIAVGDLDGGSVTIRFTRDGGASWGSGTTTVTASLHAVTFPAATLAWAVGSAGTMIRSTDGGQTWLAAPQLTAQNLNSVAFGVGSAIGYAVGNPTGSTWGAFKTTNGVTWSPLTLPGTAVSLLSVACDTSGDRVTVAGADGTVYRSTDGGATWTSQSPARLSNVAFRAVSIPGTGRVNLAGDFGTMMYSRDSGSHWLNERQRTASTLNDCWFTSSTLGWAVGDNGLLMRTTDGGATWSGRSIGTSATLNGVCFSSTTAGCVVGTGGQIWTTADGGSTWTMQSSPTTRTLNDVWFDTTGQGWTVGDSGVLLEVRNSGTTLAVRPSGTTARLNGIGAANGNSGWAAGANGVIVALAPTGGTVQSSGTNVALNSAVALTNKFAYVAGDAGTALKTVDGGKTWTNISSGIGTTERLLAVHAADTSNVWVAGTHGYVARSTNAGASFARQYSGLPTLSQDSPAAINDLWFTSTTSGFLFGQKGQIRSTADAGSTWVPHYYGTLGDLNAVKHAGASKIWAVGANGVIINSFDSGHTWYQQVSGAAQPLKGLRAVDTSVAWAVGGGGTIRRTADGGWNWVSQTTTGTQQLNSVDAVSATNAIAVGNAGTVIRTVNSGTNWTAAGSVPTSQAITGVSMSTTSTAWAVAGTGATTVMRTTDGGVTWASQTTTSTSGFNSVYFRPGTTNGWIAGLSGRIYHTTDGVNWTGQNSRTTADLYTISFSSDTTGWAAGDGGVLLSTVDAGATWARMDTGTDSKLFADASIAGIERSWVVGVGGTVLSGRDTLIPETTLLSGPDSPDGDFGWYVTTPTVQLVPNEAATTYYSWTGAVGSYQQYAEPLAPETSSATLYYYSVDLSGNTESPKSHSFQVDTSAPTTPTSLTNSGVTASGASLSWTGSSDSISGMQLHLIYLNGTYYGASTNTTVTLTGLTANTVYAATVVAVDSAGNPSAPSNISTFTTGDDGSSSLGTAISLSPSAPNGSSGWYVTTPTVTLTAVPPTATVPSRTFYSYDTTASGWTTFTAPFALRTGAHTLWYYSYPVTGTRPITYLSSYLKSDPTTPNAPASFSGTATSESSIRLTWDLVADTSSTIDAYQVYQVEGATSTLLAAVSRDTTTFDVVGLSASTTYHYKVRAINVAGTASPFTATEAVATKSPPRPNPPRIVYARGTDGDTVYVNWTASPDGLAPVTYVVWRSLDGAAYSRVATITDVYQSAYVDSNRSASTNYWYGVTAIDTRGESDMSAAPSGIATAVTGPPNRLRGVGVMSGAGTALLSWTPSGNPKTVGYYVYRTRRSMASNPTTVNAVPIGVSASSYLDSGLEVGLKYYYRVAAIDASGNVGAKSVEIMAQPRIVSASEDPHDEANGSDICAACHRDHTATNDLAVVGSHEETPATLTTVQVGPASRATWDNQNSCLGCHNGNSASDLLTALEDTVTLSTHGLVTDTRSGTLLCGSCHSSHRSGVATADPALLDVEGAKTGDAVCYGTAGCHGPGSTVIGGDLTTTFSSSVHAGINASGSAGTVCTTCHDPLSSPNRQLLDYTGYMVCMQCHTGAQPDAPDILSLISQGDSSNHLDFGITEQMANGTRISCQNCHAAMVATKQYPLVDPDSPITPWTGNTNRQCLSCHDGYLPTQGQTQPYVPSPLGAGGTTLSPDIQSAYSENKHGFGTSTSTALYLRPEMGYTTGMNIPCLTCHDGHGTVNTENLRQNVKSVDGSVVKTGVLVYPMSSTEADFRFFCMTCHDLTPARHAAYADISSFPTDCMGCHKHTTQPIGPAAGPTGTSF